MATQNEKIQKLEDELKSLKDTLVKYGDMFNADGDIDTDEQKQLDAMQAVIKKAEAKLAEIKDKAKAGRGNDAPNPAIEGDDKKKGYVYKDVTKQKLNQIINVFTKGKDDKTDVHWNDVGQGAIGDCYFMSAIGAVAKANPAALKKLIKGPDSNGNYEVTMYIDGSYFSSRKAKTVKITPEFLVDKNGNPLYAQDGDTELWVMLLEKAYAILRKDEKYWDSRVSKLSDGYNKLEGGWGEEGIEVLTGKEAKTLWIKNLSDDEIKSTITDALKDKRPITTGTIPGPEKGKKADKKQIAAQGLNIVLSHEYFVLSFDGSKITLQNPWNAEQVDGDGRGDITLDFADYKKYYRNICVQEK
ncbi:C2 family cysteine protease [Aureispira anguillae]|nr:C2 family cysteine protease [Aureispira anguillae]